MRQSVAAVLVAALLPLSVAGAAEQANPLVPGETWPALKPDVVGEAEIRDGSHLLRLDAPYRAHDAATVPVRLTELPASDKTFTRVTLVVDENPAPVAAELEIGPAMGEIEIETRFRVDSYSNVRAIAETEDGELYMVGAFVKASGGCSAPASKDAEAALAAMGQMKLRVFEEDGQGRPEAQVMVRHPNYSGLQMNQVTQLYIPAHFVERMVVRLGDELVFRMTGGISISEDPSFRFAYVPNGAEVFTVEAEDTEGQQFGQSFPVGGSS